MTAETEIEIEYTRYDSSDRADHASNRSPSKSWTYTAVDPVSAVRSYGKRTNRVLQDPNRRRSSVFFFKSVVCFCPAEHNRQDASFLGGLPLFDEPGSSALTFLRMFMSIPFMLDTEQKYGGRKASLKFITLLEPR